MQISFVANIINYCNFCIVFKLPFTVRFLLELPRLPKNFEICLDGNVIKSIGFSFVCCQQQQLTVPQIPLYPLSTPAYPALYPLPCPLASLGRLCILCERRIEKKQSKKRQKLRQLFEF